MFKILNGINKRLVKNTDLTFFRYFFPELEKDIKVIGIVGERGIGKTTALLQFAKKNDKSFYFSADNALIQSYGLFKFVYELFEDYGIENILIDEIHKYGNWTEELKNIVDSFPEKKIIFSGSSSLDIVKGTVSLERRVKILKVYPLNFREYLSLNHNIEVKNYSLDEILQNYKKISYEFSQKFSEKVFLKYFKEYFQSGFYPYGKNFSKEDFYLKIFSTLEKIIIEDLPTFIDSKSSTLIKIKKIFYFISNSTPSELNYSNLGKKIGIHPDTLENILFILSKIGIINLVPKSEGVSDLMRKEFKIYLGNPSLYFSYNENVENGTTREAFIFHFLKKIVNQKNELDIDISIPKSGDVHFKNKGKKYIFEIGGKNKTTKQIKGIENSFVISDDVMIGEGKKIPMWLFGLI